MKTNQLKIHSQEYMETMARLMSEALESPEGMRALAAAIAAPIEQEIKRMVDVSVLKNGNIGTLMDIQTSAADAIRKEMDRRTISVLSSAIPAANTIEVTGDLLTEDALNEAISIIEDLELSVKYIVMRGRRFNDMRGWNLDPQTKLELRQKGVIKNYGTGGILLTASMPLDEIIIVPDEEVGKMPVRENLKTESIDQKTRFKTGWLVWSEIGQGITRPDIMAKVKLVP